MTHVSTLGPRILVPMDKYTVDKYTAKEMTQSVKCLSQSQEDLFDDRHSRKKPGMSSCVYNPCNGEVDRGRFLEIIGRLA